MLRPGQDVKVHACVNVGRAVVFFERAIRSNPPSTRPRTRSSFRRCGRSFVAAMPRKTKRVQHLSVKEQRIIEDVIRNEKGSPKDALQRVNASRRRLQIREVCKDAVYRYVKGITHPRGAVEARGRKPALSKADVRALDQARRRLIKRAKNMRPVTYRDVVEEAALDKGKPTGPSEQAHFAHCAFLENC